MLFTNMENQENKGRLTEAALVNTLPGLLRSLLLQDAASLNGLRGVNCGIAFFDVLDFAVPIYDEGGAHAEAGGFVEDAVIFHCFTCYEIAEYGEGKPFGFRRQFVFGPI